MQLRLTTKPTYLMIASMYYASNGGFTATIRRFIRTKLAIISMRRNPIRSTYVYGNLILLSHPKQGCGSDEIKQSHACRVKYHARQGKPHTPAWSALALL